MIVPVTFACHRAEKTKGVAVKKMDIFLQRAVKPETFPALRISLFITDKQLIANTNIFIGRGVIHVTVVKIAEAEISRQPIL